MRLLWLACVAASFSAGIQAADDDKPKGRRETFTEDLVIKPLRDGKVLLHFEFGMQRPLAASGNATSHHYHLFPRQIGEIALRYKVDELHLAFTQGSWQPDRWGYPSVKSQGIGAEIRARINDSGDTKESDKQWKGLTNALSGVFCASLNFIDDSSTSKPELTFATGSASTGRATTGAVRHGYLARENVCTENLTPWIKQLPCQAKSGIGTLLNPYRLYNTHFHSMGVSLEPKLLKDGHSSVLVYKQYLAVVLDPHKFSLGNEWKLSQLLDRPVAAACPVARRSTIRVLMPDSGLKVEPSPASLKQLPNHAFHTYDLKKRPVDDIVLKFDPAADSAAPAPSPPTIVAHRYVTGHGGSSGGVETVITNNGDKAVEMSYLDTLPWYLRLYTHTLAIQSKLDADGSTVEIKPSKAILIPAVDRGRPSSIELAITLPAKSRTTLRYSFDKGFIKYTEHPPDANRGFNIGPAIITYTADSSDGLPLSCAIDRALSGKKGRCVARAYTELFLASLPTPDFSMPYNVITFTCTILALFFGRMFNLLSRDFAVLKDSDA